VAQDLNQWRALVNTMVSFRVPLKEGNFRPAERLIPSEEEFCSIELDQELMCAIQFQFPLIYLDLFNCVF